MRQVYRALLVLAFFSTSCATDRPAKVCAAEVRPLPAAWEAPAHSDLWPKPKKLETLQGASWGGRYENRGLLCPARLESAASESFPEIDVFSRSRVR